MGSTTERCQQKSPTTSLQRCLGLLALALAGCAEHGHEAFLQPTELLAELQKRGYEVCEAMPGNGPFKILPAGIVFDKGEKVCGRYSWNAHTCAFEYPPSLTHVHVVIILETPEGRCQHVLTRIGTPDSGSTPDIGRSDHEPN